MIATARPQIAPPFSNHFPIACIQPPMNPPTFSANFPQNSHTFSPTVSAPRCTTLSGAEGFGFDAGVGGAHAPEGFGGTSDIGGTIDAISAGLLPVNTHASS